MVRQRSTSALNRKLFTIGEVAEVCDVSTKTVRRWIKSGDLIAHRLGAQWRISPQDLAAFLAVRRGLNLRSNDVR